jgi:Protein of unknown function (DUF742)
VNDEDEEPLGRPFLDRALRDDLRAGAGGDGVRPYLVTGGRTRAASDLALEVLVRTTPRGRAAYATFESARALALCAEIQSVAEVAARLRLPIGVARVLVGDLAAAGLLEVCGVPQAGGLREDAVFLERLIHGVAAL